MFTRGLISALLGIIPALPQQQTNGYVTLYHLLRLSICTSLTQVYTL